MAIWQEDNPLRRRLEKKVRDKYNIDKGDELELFIRVELG